MTRVLGIDIGSRGAIAIVDDETGELVEVQDMPTLETGPKARPAVKTPATWKRAVAIAPMRR